MKATRDESWDIWEEENSKGIDFAKVLQKIKAYWPLSLLGALIMTGLALLYLYKANPVYNVKAAVLIQDSEKKRFGKRKYAQLAARPGLAQWRQQCE